MGDAPYINEIIKNNMIRRESPILHVIFYNSTISRKNNITDDICKNNIMNRGGVPIINDIFTNNITNGVLPHYYC